MVLASVVYQVHMGKKASVTDWTAFGELVAIGVSFLSHKP